MCRSFRLSGVWLIVLLCGYGMGCGTPGAPQAPSLDLPIPVENLTAARIGDSVHLAWTMPLRTTDHLPLKHPVAVDVCRAVAGLPCAQVGRLVVAPGAAGTYQDLLPPDLMRAPPRLLRYELTLRNHAGKGAGASNGAYSATGPGPAVISDLRGEVQSGGVVLSWQPVAEDSGQAVLYRIARRLLGNPEPAGGARPALSLPASPADQTLAVHSSRGVDPGHALDTDALFNRQYSYQVKRVATQAVEGRSIDVQGPDSEVVTVSTRDIFPPATPSGLVAAADAAGGAIDLSWAPDGESDLAGYRLYRREAQDGSPPQRLAEAGVDTGFRDTTARREQPYRYSVTALDQNGNESKPSPEVEETLPKP